MLGTRRVGLLTEVFLSSLPPSCLAAENLLLTLLQSQIKMLKEDVEEWILESGQVVMKIRDGRGSAKNHDDNPTTQ